MKTRVEDDELEWSSDEEEGLHHEHKPWGGDEVFKFFHLSDEELKKHLAEKEVKTRPRANAVSKPKPTEQKSPRYQQPTMASLGKALK